MAIRALRRIRRLPLGSTRLIPVWVGSLGLLLVLARFGGATGELPSAVAAGQDGKPRVETLLGRLPLYFIENRGQEDPRVAYYVPGRNITTYFTADGVTFAFTSPTPRRALARTGAFASEPVTRERWALKLDFVGARPVMPQGQELTPAVFSYFKGPESQWRTGLRTYAGLIYPDLWPGIDLVYGGSARRLKYTFLVRPGADPGQIKLAYRGASAVVLDRGRLEVSTPVGGFSEDRPYVYQEVDGRRIEIPSRYALAGQHSYGFDIGAYDRSRPLVLDPSYLVYAGYIGGSGAENANAIAVDSAGNAYVAGATDSTVPSFPAQVGPDLTQGGDLDAFVAKVRADGTGLVYAGYIGGSASDEARGIAVDSAGNAYVAGITSSTQASFPVTVGPEVVYTGGPSDAFVAKVRADGTGLVYAGYIGGAGEDAAFAIAVVGSSAYVAGRTNSNESSFPVTNGPSVVHRGGFDAFVAKVKTDGTGLVYAGYIGGAGDDAAIGIAVNSAGNAFVAGSTASNQSSFPATVGPDLTYNGGISDGFVAKVKGDGTGLLYAGYIGGGGQDIARAIAVDSAGSAYVTGRTDSNQTTFPVVGGPDVSFNGGTDAFVAKVKADGTGLVYSGYIGGPGSDEGNAIKVDSTGAAYVAGTTGSDTGFPLRAGPDLFYNGGATDAFVAKVKPDGSGLLYAGYIGGEAQDVGRAIAVDADGNAYVAGDTASDEDFPALVGPDLTFNSTPNTLVFDGFVVKVSGKSDLSEGSVSIPTIVKRGASFTVTSTATNAGLGTAPASTTRYYLSVDGEKSNTDIQLSGSKSVPSLAPLALSTGSATVTVPNSTPVGSYFVLACADDPHVVAELDEGFNCGASFSQIQVTLPDLRVDGFAVPTSNFNAGQSVTMTDTVRNVGAVAAGSSTTRYYLVQGGSRIRLTGSRSVPSLAAGSFSQGGATITIPSGTPAGNYSLQACADDLSAVAETNENNNCLTGNLTVTVSSTGSFELSPAAATVLPDELVLYRLTWITPTVWQELAALELRFVGSADGKVIFRVRWDQASNTFVLVADDGAPTGRAVAPGSTEILQTGNAVLHLDQTTVVTGGAIAPDVTLTLAMTFKSEAAGQDYRDYRVEVLATDDGGRQQGFTEAGTLRVERSAPASASLTGSASSVGSGTDNGSIRLQGQFTAAEPVALDQATLTLSALLDEVGGAGELTRGTSGAAVLPLTLTARTGGKPTDAIYQTASGVRPVVWAEIKTRDARTGLTEFYIKVDRATIPVGPALCSGGSSPTTQLRTRFSVQASNGAPVGVDLTLPWRCLGTELKTP
ncbi:MAG TPA: SBBP repeat-containing protein [Methylomirabilota bacterium]|nr:SBBP repeat-containing protein [Methylomirabilota bacterium]